ncbi:MAG: hypothetical protein AMXMBFR33_07590 [Candidatus Xenobia bacterium]|jgi:hypothetical protein
MIGGAGTGAANAAAQQQMVHADKDQAHTIQAQMQADAQKQQAERWKILRETQTKIFEIQQDVTVNQAKAQDKAFNKWSDYIKA